jgi:hypothetical protein
MICMNSTSPRGFVDMVGEVNVIRDGYEITGVVDMIVCGTCMEQACRLVGCASQQEVENFAYRELELMTQLDKAKDEAHAERQRHEQFIAGIHAFQSAEE